MQLKNARCLTRAYRNNSARQPRGARHEEDRWRVPKCTWDDCARFRLRSFLVHFDRGDCATPGTCLDDNFASVPAMSCHKASPIKMSLRGDCNAPVILRTKNRARGTSHAPLMAQLRW